MDDFGEFLQAPPSVGENPMKPNALSRMKQPVDLNSKILSSFDLSGSSQKATFKFQQPVKHLGRRPQESHFRQSSSSADWKNISLENEFVTPTPPHQTFVHQSRQFTGNTLPPPSSQALNADLLGLAVSNNPSPIAHAMNTPQMGHGNQHPIHNNAACILGAPQATAVTGIHQFHTFTNAHFTNPQQDARNSNFVHAHQSNTVVSESHPVKTSGTSTTISGSLIQSERRISHPLNSQPAYGLLAKQEMNSVGSQNGNRMEHDKSSSNGSFLPSWMTDPNQIPPVYKQVLKATATNNSFADTNLLYPIFLSSELPKDILGHIWTVANQSTPGKLTFTEVYTALALIALAQKGEMDLSTRFVLKLQTAPIPEIKLPQSNEFSFSHLGGGAHATPKYASSSVLSEASGSSNQFLNFNLMNNSQSSNSEAFAEFQSFSSSEPSIQNQLHHKSGINTFEDQPSIQSSATDQRNTFLSPYPDRDLINSPKHTPKSDACSHDQPRQLLGSINFSKFDDKSSSKILHSAAKKLNVSQRPVIPTALIDDDFDDFKSAEPCATVSKNSLEITSIANIVQGNPRLPYLQPDTSMEKTDRYTALRIQDPIAQPPVSLKVGNLVTPASDDKYAVFRDIELAKITEHSGLEDFVDLQSVESHQHPTTQPSLLLDDNLSTASHSDMSKVLVSEDISAISSFELPSLSRTILNNSIGTTVTSELPDTLGLPNENKLNFASILSVSKSDIALSQTNFHINSADDGLYDLDEPISPVYQRKHVVTSSKTPEPPKNDSSVIHAKISNLSDSDFADFSAGPPPIDDDVDLHDADFELQEGDSSLVDFDAFGHFEEEKMEVQKKKESAFKRTREDATAFSEFVKSSVIDLKPAPSHEISMTVPKQDTKQCAQEDSSATESKYYQNDDSDGTLSFDVNSNIEENSSVTSGWKLEPTCPEVQTINNSLGIGSSEWEEEGNEMKARMEGSSNPMEIFIDHWSRCLSTCKDIIVSTGDVFASLNSPSVCHEVVNSKRGREFISCTSEVYGVSRRIRKGMELVGLEDEDLALSLKEIEIAWNNLLGFCPYTPSVHKTPEHRINANRERTMSACSLCLLDTESTQVSGLEYCGRFYHAPCANLWLNQIAPILPRLEASAT